MDIVGDALAQPDESAVRTSVALRLLGQLGVSRWMFDRPGEELFVQSVEQVIRRRRMAEGEEPDEPIEKPQREDALARMATENETEEVA
jgi:hypothetical protein